MLSQPTASFQERIKPSVKVGGMNLQRNRTARGLKIKSSVKVGIMQNQHSQMVGRGLKVGNCMRAGEMQMQHNPFRSWFSLGRKNLCLAKTLFMIGIKLV